MRKLKKLILFGFINGVLFVWILQNIKVFDISVLKNTGNENIGFKGYGIHKRFEPTEIKAVLPTTGNHTIRVNIFENSTVNNTNNTDPQPKLNSVQRLERIRSASFQNPINFIPSQEELASTEVRPYITSDVLRPFVEIPNMTFTESVAIVTPLRNSEKVLSNYKNQLCALNYPHRLLSVFFGESGSTDKTLEKAKSVTDEFTKSCQFHYGEVFQLPVSGGFYGPMSERHKEKMQLFRRAHIAQARNSLLDFVLNRTDVERILWIDSDMSELPHDLIQQLIFSGSDVVTTPCLMKGGSLKVKYDRNSWQETEQSLKDQAIKKADELIVEGYGKSYRRFLPDLMALGRVVPLDGVGGCVLMVKTECHRKGLRFPEHVYKHHIETEGLAKLAKDMGFSVAGLPFVEAFHGFN